MPGKGISRDSAVTSPSPHVLANGSPGMPILICQQSFCSCSADSIGPCVCFTPIYSKYVALAIGYDGRSDIRFTDLYLEDYMELYGRWSFERFKAQTHASYLRVVLRPTKRSWVGDRKGDTVHCPGRTPEELVAGQYEEK